MKNIHVIPTDKPSRLQKTKHNNFFLANRTGYEYTDCTAHNIYITSDEEIKEEHLTKEIYVIDIQNGNIGKLTCKNRFFKGSSKLIEIEWKNKQNIWNYNHIREIILTTDQDLIKDGVQAIDDEFLEWFVNNPSCEEVEVDILWNDDENFTHDSYEIIIPKEEPKNVKGGDDIVFPEREVKLEDVFNDEKKEGLKQFIQDYKEKPWRDFEVEYNAFINSGGLNGETGEGWINHSKLIPWLKENYIITKKN